MFTRRIILRDSLLAGGAAMVALALPESGAAAEESLSIEGADQRFQHHYIKNGSRFISGITGWCR
jgi:hypothetical protein